MDIAVPEDVLRVLALLEGAGFEAWIVGGCVRDSLLGRMPADWDVATAATPEETAAALHGIRVLPTGVRHGTVTAVLPGGNIEITTYRAETGSSDHRHPAALRFSGRIEEDLARRDFTVNALAYHPRRGLLDAFGGGADLRAGILRTVGDPALRFNEDALRILRLLRFAATLGFSIESGTGRAAIAQKDLLHALSHERVREELTRLLPGRWAAQVLRAYPEVVFTVLPELRPMMGCGQESPYHCFDVWEHTLHALDAAEADPIVRWAALLHDCGKPDTKSTDSAGAHFYGHAARSEAISREILERMRFSRRDGEAILQLVALHMEQMPPTEKRLKKLLARLGEAQLFRLLDLIRADWAAQTPGLLEQRLPGLVATESAARRLLAEESTLTLKDLAISGKDLLALGYSPSPALGRALHRLLDEVLDDRLENTRETLLRRAGELAGEESANITH